LESLWRIAEVQGRKNCSWKFQDCQGKLVADVWSPQALVSWPMAIHTSSLIALRMFIFYTVSIQILIKWTLACFMWWKILSSMNVFHVITSRLFLYFKSIFLK
jgi:hypothetical protein